MESLHVDYSRKWYVLIAVAMGIFLATIDGSIVNVALPTLSQAFGTTFAAVQWVILAYLLTVATLLLGVGRLADMRGKKPIYLTGFVVFTTGSFLCALSPSVYYLIGFRVLQAVGASMVFALGIAIVTEAFPPTERGKAIGLAGSIVSIGVVIGPTLGGLLIDALSWHWIFLVNVPVGIIGTAMALRFVPDFRASNRQRFDYLGALTLCISLIGFLLALTLGQDTGFGAPLILGLFAIWAVFLVIFLIVELRSASPMVDLSLFGDTLFTSNLTTGFVAFVALSGMFLLLPFYLENMLGFDVRLVGVLLAVVPVALGIMAPISGVLSDRYGPQAIVVTGLLIMLLGFWSASTLTLNTSIFGYVLRMTPVGIGLGVFQSPNNSAIMGAAPRERLGVASGLLSITRTLGQVVGIAILGAIWASRAMIHAGTSLMGDATQLPVLAQAEALHDTFLVMAFLTAIALVVALVNMLQGRQPLNVPKTGVPIID